MCKVNDMMIIVDKETSVIDKGDGLLIITRPSVLGGIASHSIKTEYSAKEVAEWLGQHRMVRPFVQEAFPNMALDDREFILSGITPKVWAEKFPPQKKDASEEGVA
jgi:hypothetical protein